ncbi:zinc finger FYVE domain-containing protein 26 [Caerostris extrusa]|uniref:Zinc finger FYVE domain-containing protein 26 n=1 Tax=Caerostris extrusa TaxID=172846 RepID=A0AAV4M5U3_CAEEX|nr:zinc finger FYVE domain-containing protein 26 [Caerostris extrusa]
MEKRGRFQYFTETFFKSSKSVLTELSSVHSHLLKIIHETSSSEHLDFNLVLSDESILSLKNAFSENPIIISKLLNMIYVPIDLNIDSNLNSVICDVHCQYLLRCMRALKSKSLKSNKSQNFTDSVLKIYTLLSIFPEYILDTTIKEFCMKNILNGSWTEAQSLLNDSLLSRLKPLLLILSWNACQSDTSAMNVIEAVKVGMRMALMQFL